MRYVQSDTNLELTQYVSDVSKNNIVYCMYAVDAYMCNTMAQVDEILDILHQPDFGRIEVVKVVCSINLINQVSQIKEKKILD